MWTKTELTLEQTQQGVSYEILCLELIVVPTNVARTLRRDKVYNWETATYGKIWDNEDVHDLGSVETEFPAIVFNDTLTSEAALCDDEDWLRYLYGVSWGMDMAYRLPVQFLGPCWKEIDNVGGEFTNLEIVKCWSLETSRRLFNTRILAQ
ncbi:hypothetical protein Tco_0610408 [Tanacetum coccineum]